MSHTTQEQPGTPGCYRPWSLGDLQKSNSEGCQKLLSLLNLLLSKNVIWSALVAREPFGYFLVGCVLGVFYVFPGVVLVDPKNQILKAVKNHYVIKTFYYVRMQSGVFWWPGSLLGTLRCGVLWGSSGCFLGCLVGVFRVLILYNTIPYHSIPSNTPEHNAMPHHTTPHHTIPYHIRQQPYYTITTIKRKSLKYL